MGAKFLGGKSIPGEVLKRVAEANRPDQGKQGNALPQGLRKFAAGAAGDGFAFGHSGGAPTVQKGEDRSGHEVTGATNLHVGSSLQPAKPKNVLAPPKKAGLP